MLQVPQIRAHKEEYIEALKKRNFNASDIFSRVLELDEQRRSTQSELDDTLAESKRLSREVGLMYKNGDHLKAEHLKEKSSGLKEKAKDLSEKMAEAADSLQKELYNIPNIPHSSVPTGASEEDNVEIFREGEVPELGAHAMPHWELAKKFDIIDFDLGNKITGAGFPVYKGKGARLQRALISYFLDKNIQAGYQEYQMPLMVNEASGYGTGQLPDKEGQMYHVTEDNLYLIPTAEVPITNMFRGELLSEAVLPIACTGYTPCFRREAGSYGAHVRGLNRLHQFDKVELVRVEKPENSYAALNDMVEQVKNILRDLKLPFRILRLCGGDLGFTSALTYDFEVFSTAQDRWLEISSCSNFESFQANRLKLRYKAADGNKQLVHTLNGSALALPRVMAGILENCQTPEGIKIPQTLVPYAGFELID